MPPPVRFQLPLDADDPRWAVRIMEADLIEGKEDDFVDAVASAAYLAGVHRQHRNIEGSIYMRRVALKLLDNLPVDRQHGVVIEAGKQLDDLDSSNAERLKTKQAVLGVVDELAALAAHRAAKASMSGVRFQRSSERNLRGHPPAFYESIEPLLE